jgi:carbamoyltransferase
MQSEMNLKIKFRESFRPFAPMVLLEFVDQYFEMRADEESPYMQIVAPVHKEHRLPARSAIPAVTHVDYSARLQTIDRHRNPLMYKLLTCFHQQTGCPVMINTSFNVRSEPIVCTPMDAYRCFLMTEMDTLVIGNYVLHKSEQPKAADTSERERYLKRFEQD